LNGVIIILQLALTASAATLFGQKFTAVEVSTTTPLREALRICKNVGELGWYYSLDYDEHTDSLSAREHATYWMANPWRWGIPPSGTEDSLYTVSFTDSLPDDQLRAQHWSVISGGRGVLSYEGNLYYMIEYPFCVPLVKRNDTFCFHIPHSLPSLYYLDQAIEQESLSVMPGGYAASVGELSFNVLVSAVHTGRAKALLKKGLTDAAHRDCYVDLDTGGIKNL
jgi:hypothetical protein